MSVWAQVSDARVTAVPPDGRTIVDIYANFSFAGDPVPDGTQIHFLIGKGAAPQGNPTLADLQNALTPVTGVELFSNVGVTDLTFVRDNQGGLSALHVATVSMKPVSDLLKDNITIIAYSTFDKLGTATRLAFGSVTLTVSSGSGVFLSELERYDPIGNIWTTKAPMPTGRSGPFCATVSLSGDKIHAIGGFNSNFTNVNEQYDPALDVWTTKSPLPIARAFGSVAVVSNKIYVIGGYNFDPGRASNLLDVYDPVADSWTSLAPLPIPLAFSTAQVIGTNIWVFYGAIKFTDLDGLDTANSGVLKYDTVGDSWTIHDAVVAGAASGTLASSAALGAFSVSTSAQLGITGFATINRGGGTQETVRYLSNQNGVLLLSAPLQFAHLSGETVIDAAIPRVRLSPNSYINGAVVKILDGSDANNKANGAIEYFNTATSASTVPVLTAASPRYKASSAVIGTTEYIVGGSSSKSDYLGIVEKIDEATDVITGPSGLTKMLIFRTSGGAAAAFDGVANYVFYMGGQGSGHSSGWLKLIATASPDLVRADGRQTASVTVTATDAGGDPPPDGTKVLARGLIFISQAQQSTTTAATNASSATGSATTVAQERNPPPTISILPVLFSSTDMTFVGGTAATVLLARSEDFVNEVENLLSFVKGNEKVIGVAALKSSPLTFSNQKVMVGESRSLYSVAIEITVQDPFFFGQTDSEAAAGGVPNTSLSSSQFSFNPPSAGQGSSATVRFFSDITSMPDVQIVTPVPVDLPTINLQIDALKDEIPFGASPHYDALVTGAEARIVPPPALPLLPPSNMMVSASDNENSGSASTAQDVADAANLVAGAFKFPIFVVTVVVTDPISLAARAERTDVADLELISSETGGNSFSLDNPGYVNFIIDRIKTSAPSSIGSGSVTVLHQINGSISLIRFIVSNMIAGNSAVLTGRYSLDGYNFKDLGVNLIAAVGPGAITSTFTFGTPLLANFIEYTVTMDSKTFDSPILDSVSIQFITPSVQYLFTFPQNVGGQISELAAVTNQRVPAGSTIDVGFVHGTSLEFDRDYRNNGQPSIQDRGTIMAINRSFGTVLNGTVFRDVLTSDDFIIYHSKTGPWAQDAVTRVFVNELEVLPGDFIPVPESGTVVFRKRLSSADAVTIEIQNQSSFRVGLKILNPTLSAGVLDSFAFMWGETAANPGLKPNRPPEAINLFITPSPAVPAGPLTANYTYVDPDGDPEDTSQSQIIWYRNGSPITELTNKKVISNTDLIATRTDSPENSLISRGQEWFFSVRPSDGIAFGPLAVSGPVTIVNRPPTATAAQLKSSNLDDPLTFTSSDSISVIFTFSDPDGDTEAGSIYTFFVNGVQVKSGTDNSLSPSEEDSAGNKFIAAGKSVSAQVLPSDGTDFGAAATSNTITILGTAPSVQNVSVLPTKPTAASSLLLSYQFVSVDNAADQSTIAWFSNDVRRTDFDNLKQIPQGNLIPGQQWYAIVTPSDGNNQGSSVKSNVVLVQI